MPGRAGSALFGIGWGMAGLCPGPAVTDLVTGHPGILLFVGAMLVGALAHDFYARLAHKKRGR